MSFPSLPDQVRRARIEHLVAELLDLLDAMDEAGTDREPDVDAEDDGDEADLAPLSLCTTLAPQRRIRRRAAA